MTNVSVIEEEQKKTTHTQVMSRRWACGANSEGEEVVLRFFYTWSLQTWLTLWGVHPLCYCISSHRCLLKTRFLLLLLFFFFLTATVKTSASHRCPWSNQTTSTCALHLVANFEKLNKLNDLSEQTGPVQEGKVIVKVLFSDMWWLPFTLRVGAEAGEAVRDLIDAIADVLISTGCDMLLKMCRCHIFN